jgi:hypothetical protein
MHPLFLSTNNFVETHMMSKSILPHTHLFSLIQKSAFPCSDFKGKKPPILFQTSLLTKINWLVKTSPDASPINLLFLEYNRCPKILDTKNSFYRVHSCNKKEGIPKTQRRNQDPSPCCVHYIYSLRTVNA